MDAPAAAETVCDVRAGDPMSWQKARKACIDRDRYCQARDAFPDVECWSDLHVHHKLRRSQGGTDDLSNLVLLCSVHHDAVHANPARSVELGLLDRRGAVSKVVPRPEMREAS